MKEYVLIFRASLNPDFKPSQEQAQQMMTGWMNWMNNIKNDNKMADEGTRLGISNSKVVRTNDVITNGPFTEVKEFINGFIVVKTNTLDEAVQIAKECPIIIGGGGTVEVRPAVSPDDNS